MKGKIKRIGRVLIKVTAFALLAVTAFVCGAVTNQAFQDKSSHSSESIVNVSSRSVYAPTKAGYEIPVFSLDML